LKRRVEKMTKKRTLFLGIILATILICAGSAFSQEQAAKKPLAQEVTSETESQWIWGDVVSVDPVAKKLVVKYLDYETDTEKEINIELDDKTTYENVKSADEIKAMDTLSVDYTVSTGGKNIAKNISVERPEGVQTGTEATTSAVTDTTTTADIATIATPAANNTTNTTVNSTTEEPKVAPAVTQ
jgi:hypothetical protein